MSIKFIEDVLERLEPIPGAVICVMQTGNRWIIGQNDREKTSPHWTKRYRDTTETRSSRHAEEHALQMLERIENKKVKRVVVIRWNKKGAMAMSRPCPTCERKLESAGIKRTKIFFSDTEGAITPLSYP